MITVIEQQDIFNGGGVICGGRGLAIIVAHAKIVADFIYVIGNADRGGADRESDALRAHAASR
jgi:hypothetical protein